MIFRAAVILLLIGTCSRAQSPDETRRRYLTLVENALAVKPGDIVADIGSGDSPEFLPVLSRLVGPSGKVICVDISQKVLDQLGTYLEQNHLANVEKHLGRPDDPVLAPGSVQAVFISFAYHEMEDHGAMLAHIRTALRPGARLVIIEAISEKNRGASRENQVKKHELSPDTLAGELSAAGFETLNDVVALVDGGGVLRYLIAARAKRE